MIIHLKKPSKVVVFSFEDDGVIPNSSLPLFIYREAIAIDRGCRITDVGKKIRELIAANQWDVQWTWRIYRRLHYHSTAHEALVVIAGTATIQLGGRRLGHTVKIGQGDFVIIPAGVAHQCLKSAANFSVVGAYPLGQVYDMCWGKKNERNKAVHNISKVLLPENDPLYGPHGPLLKYWTHK